MTPAPAPQPQAESWRTFQTLIVVAGVVGACFLAGVSYGGVKDAATKQDTFQERVERMFVRKDGRELAIIQGDLKILNSKVDLLLKKEGLQIP